MHNDLISRRRRTSSRRKPRRMRGIYDLPCTWCRVALAARPRRMMGVDDLPHIGVGMVVDHSAGRTARHHHTHTHTVGAIPPSAQDTSGNSVTDECGTPPLVFANGDTWTSPRSRQGTPGIANVNGFVMHFFMRATMNCREILVPCAQVFIAATQKCRSPNYHRSLCHDLISRSHECPKSKSAEDVSRKTSIQAVPGRTLEGALAPSPSVAWCFGGFRGSLGGASSTYPPFAHEFSTRRSMQLHRVRQQRLSKPAPSGM